ncbi:nitrogen fixation protein NifQ [Rhodoferax sp. GW822-FHT02A01]|uniref:nitrogen fixation protein NifQ n=1 Tax=Rhodoferax sp. GW822-FHT02A01 TaxID=3141537 RepID=UPI00315CE7AA
MNASHNHRELLQAELLARPVGAAAQADPLRSVLVSMVVGRSLNLGVLSATLGLPLATFQTLWQDYFDGDTLWLEDGPGEAIVEQEDLQNLLLEYRAHRIESEVWLAQIVAYGCSGRDHLWQDLGLANRGELSLLMTTAFPALAALNTGDMKWKKFLYRHYCSREGIYVCPAPSCGECADHAKCFGKEE